MVRGSAAGILRAERIALNFMQRMSGIASDTNRYVQAVDGLNVRIVDTRKTVPGHRYLDKYSVRMGGGPVEEVAAPPMEPAKVYMSTSQIDASAPASAVPTGLPATIPGTA